MENLQWIFDGVGTELLSLVIGAIGGGIAGYKLGVKRNGKQKQTAKSDAKQRQEMVMDGELQNGGQVKLQNGIRQTQKAGKNSEQIQTGRIRDGKQ